MRQYFKVVRRSLTKLNLIFIFRDDDGSLRGFDVDLVRKVCEVAKKKCEIVLQPFTECTFTERGVNFPGRGNRNFHTISIIIHFFQMQFEIIDMISDLYEFDIQNQCSIEVVNKSLSIFICVRKS